MFRVVFYRGSEKRSVGSDDRVGVRDCAFISLSVEGVSIRSFVGNLEDNCVPGVNLIVIWASPGFPRPLSVGGLLSIDFSAGIFCRTCTLMWFVRRAF